MAALFTTEFGNVIIDDEVIAKVAGLAALECYGVVGMVPSNRQKISKWQFGNLAA